MTLEEIQLRIDRVSDDLRTQVFSKALLGARELLSDLPDDIQTPELLRLRGNVLRLACAAAWQQSDNHTAHTYGNQALAIATELGDRHGELAALGLLANIFLRFSDYEKAIELYTNALAIAESLDDTVTVAKTLGNIGVTYQTMGNITQAIEYLEKSIELSQHIHDAQGVATALGNVALCYEDQAEYMLAIEYQTRAFAMHEQMNDTRSMAISLNNLGTVCKTIGDYPRALEYLAQALRYYEEVGYKQGTAYCLTNMGSVYELLGEYGSALENFTQALDITANTGQKLALAQITNNIGGLYEKKKEYDTALEFFGQSLSISRELGSEYGITLNTANIAGVYGAMQRYNEAFEEFTKALALAEVLDNPEEYARIRFNLGALYATPAFEKYDSTKAEGILLDVLRTAREIGHKELNCSCCESLASLYERREKWQDALSYTKQFYILREQISGEEIKQQAKKVAYERQIAVMQREQEVTDRILHKFLPSPIIPDVKAKEGQILVERYDSVSILFADLVGFTMLSLKISPTLMVEMLNHVFTHFDTIIKEHGGHRLRTMGDGYFAVMGVPDRHDDHARRLALAALEMQKGLELPEKIMKQLPEGTSIKVRIGLNSGEVVAGMVGGLEKWQYDVYGDTVNTASRMESHGEPGKIHCTEEFKHAVETLHATSLQFIRRGEMDIKGKGKMKTYFLEKESHQL